MEDSPYSFEQEQEDLEYFLSKFGWSKFELDEYLSRPPKPHNFYKSEGNYGDEFLEGISSGNETYGIGRMFQEDKKKSTKRRKGRSRKERSRKGRSRKGRRTKSGGFFSWF